MSKISNKILKSPLLSKTEARSERGVAYTDLMFEIFRINNRINVWGDRFSTGTGLTGARWRVLGSTLPEPKQVSQIARERGMTRQSVQQIANSLVSDGLARFKDNERHKSSKLLEPTALGRKAILQLNARYATVADGLSDGCTAAELKAATKLLAKLSTLLDIDESS
jgi:DNA-binding MarR family transcriptional regulator